MYQNNLLIDNFDIKSILINSNTIKKIEILLHNRQNPNIQNKTLYTPLMYAGMNNDINLVKLLLKYN
jgi:ankyrin repeat protein